MGKQPELYCYTVQHPVYGESDAVAADLPQAVMQACFRWDAPFKSTAGDCTVIRRGKAQKPRCRKCGKEYGKTGDKPGLCPDCVHMEELLRRDMAAIRKPDRRAGLRN